MKLMLAGTRSIRLTRREIERWSRITGFEPIGIYTLEDFRQYVAACKCHYWGVSEETRFLHWLMDEEVARCLAGQFEAR